MNDELTLREKVARAIFARLEDYPVDGKVVASVFNSDAVDDVREAASDAIALVLEAAAGVAETWASSLKPGSPDRLNGHLEARRDIATAIRNLGRAA